ncbi:hypothetical protein LZL87_014086 [Fusarium oxysporum]|nr:hypothetical protein LZL87_014086 [Fusarium oxysporum]
MLLAMLANYICETHREHSLDPALKNSRHSVPPEQKVDQDGIGPEVRKSLGSFDVVLIVKVNPQALPARSQVPAGPAGAGEALVNSKTLDGVDRIRCAMLDRELGMSEAIYTILICLLDHGFASRTESNRPRSIRMWRITLLVDTECVMFRLHTVTISGRNTEESLLRISMPVMNGYEAIVRIRKSGVRLLIIAITAYALKGDMELCLEKGVDDYIAKPVNRQLLMRKMLKWLAAPTDADGGRKDFP